MASEKKHIVKSGQDLGSIARAYGIVSWKYLYEKNKQAVGDNPDLLKPGTELEIPQWDSTSGDEKLKAKGAEPEQWTGVGYRYPWTAVSFTIANNDGTVYREKDDKGKERKDFAKKKKYEIRNCENKAVLVAGEIGSSEELSVLVPDVKDKVLFVDGEAYHLWIGKKE